VRLRGAERRESLVRIFLAGHLAPTDEDVWTLIVKDVETTLLRTDVQMLSRYIPSRYLCRAAVARAREERREELFVVRAVNAPRARDERAERV
jgi:hypothetical protein